MRTLIRYLKLPLILVTALFSAQSLADRVQVPLTLDHRFLETLLRDQVFTGDGDSVRVNDDGSGCQYLDLSEPRVSASVGRVLLRTVAAARVGRVVGGRCLLMLDWRGRLEFTQVPSVGDDGKSLLLRTSSWRVLEPDGRTAAVSTTIGRWLEQFLPVGLKQTRVDFADPIDQLEDFLALLVTPGEAGRAGALLGALAIDGIDAGNDRVTVRLGIDATPIAVVEQRVEPVLSASELSRLEQRLDALDAFFTFAIRSVAGEPDEQESADLLGVLVQLRLELVAILGERQRAATDPVRSLFVETWEGLVPVLRVIAERQPDHATALHYLTFIGAGDALQALDSLGPAAGIEVSSDGLRRLARILIPDEVGDPLRRDEGVDAELRRSLGFGEPLPPPESHSEGYDGAVWLGWFIAPVLAADGLDPATVKRLNSWVPKTRDMDTYLPMVRDVLRHVVTEQLRANELEGAYHEVFRWLVFAAAWQESCWRQFVAENDKRVPMQSGSGDIGMMQINPKVWRGFYDLQGLRWDIVYNVRAGADILEHHMISYGIRHGEHQKSGGIDNLARSTYAAYNGGPRQYDRYRRADASARGKKVDELFYAKYRQLKSGEELAVASCY